MNNPRLFTTEEISILFQVSEYTARRWCRDGKLKATRTESRWLVHQDDLNAYWTKLGGLGVLYGGKP